MADKADQALKLAQNLEKDLKAMEKRLLELDKKFTDAHNEQNKSMDEIDKRYTGLHNEQSKKIAEVVAWAQKTFDTKGFF